MNYYFTASGCMSERIRHRCEKTNLCSPVHSGRRMSRDLRNLWHEVILVFSLRGLMREFAAAGGKMIIHGAHHTKNTPTPEITNNQ